MTSEIPKPISAGFIFGWVVGCIFLIAGVMQIVVGNFLTGIIYLLLTLLILPPAWRDISGKFKINLSRGARITVVILGMLIAGVFMDLSKMESDDSVNKVDRSDIQTIVEKYIPGLTAADVTLNFENKGFNCPEMEIEKDGSATWRCEDTSLTHDYFVEVHGDSPYKITSVQATALNYGTDDTNRVTREFLSYAASLPFDGSDPATAKDWVWTNLGQNNLEHKFGGVTFRLGGNADTRARMLTIEIE